MTGNLRQGERYCKLRVLGAAFSALVLLPGVLGATVKPVSAQVITFEQILANPDDLQLNLDYARQEVASGRLQQAASALERLLLNKPNWDSVRLFYGIVLYRLGDMKGAERELSILEGRGLSPSQEKDRTKYLARARHKNSGTRISGQVAIGGRVDSNPGRISSDPAFQIPGLDEETDTAITASSRVRIESDIASGQGDYWFAQHDGYLNEFSDADNADLMTTTVQTGFVFHGVDTKFVPYAFYGKSLLQHEYFRNRWGAGARAYWSITPQTELFVTGEYASENYHLTSFSPVGDQRDGTKISGRAGIIWRPSDSQKFTFEGNASRKNSNFDGFSYHGSAVQAHSLTLLGEGFYMALTARYSMTEYDQPDLFNSAVTTREDDRFYARAAFGAPLQSLFQNHELPDSIADIVAQVGVSWTTQESSINVLDFDNLSGDVMFTKRFEF